MRGNDHTGFDRILLLQMTLKVISVNYSIAPGFTLRQAINGKGSKTPASLNLGKWKSVQNDFRYI